MTLTVCINNHNNHSQTRHHQAEIDVIISKSKFVEIFKASATVFCSYAL